MFSVRKMIVAALLMLAFTWFAKAQTSPGFIDEVPLCANYPNTKCSNTTPTNPLSLNQAFTNKADYPLPTISVASANPPILCNGSDQTANLNTLLAALQTAGTGGTLQFQACTYLFSSGTCITLPNDGATVPNQVPFIFQGVGNFDNASYTPRPTNGTIFDMRCTDTYGRIKSFGLGVLRMRGITITNNGSSTGTPFIYVTNTVASIKENTFWGAADRTTANQNEDVIVYGGTTTTAGGGPAAPFQGYISDFSNNYVNYTRRMIVGQTFWNGGLVSYNYNGIQSGCGSLTGPACVIIDITGNVSSAIGPKFIGNVFEVENYNYCMRLTAVVGASIIANDAFDQGTGTLGCVYLNTNSVNNTIIPGYIGNGTPGNNYVVDPNGYMAAGSETFLSAYNGEPSNFGLMNAYNLTITQAASAGVNLSFGGAIAFGSGSFLSSIGANVYGFGSTFGAFNGYVHAASGEFDTSIFTPQIANVTNNGPIITIPSTYLGIFDRTAANTNLDLLGSASKTGGYLSISSSSSGADTGDILKIAPTTASSNATNVLASFGVPVRVPGFTIGALPSCVAGLAGARAYVTNGQTTPTFLGTVSTTGAVVAPVFCNGSAWVYG